MKLNKDIIYYIAEDLDEKVGFFLNCKTNVIIKLDSIAIDYFFKIINAKSKDDIIDYLPYFEGCDFFE